MHATPIVWKCGPGPSKPPPITLGISGGGFGEKVLSTTKAIQNGIKSISVFKVDKEFGEFMEVDKSYWTKAVMPFIGEQVNVLFMCFFLLNNLSTAYNHL